MKEELTIDIEEQDVKLQHTAHRTFEDGREYFDFYFDIYNFSWELKIWEPDKCSDIDYYSVTELSSVRLLQHDQLALENIEKWLTFSELFLKDDEY